MSKARTIAREADGFITPRGSGNQHRLDQGIHRTVACLFLFACTWARSRKKFQSCAALHRQLLALPQKTDGFSPRPIKSESSPSFTIAWTISCFSGAHLITHAMDGALKLKKVSYIHAKGYPTGKPSMGECADRFRLPLVMIATCDRNDAGSVIRYEKNVSNMEGFKKQGAT